MLNGLPQRFQPTFRRQRGDHAIAFAYGAAKRRCPATASARMRDKVEFRPAYTSDLWPQALDYAGEHDHRWICVADRSQFLLCHHAAGSFLVQLSSNEILLVTGATGLVGSHVAEQARRKGVPVRALVRQGAETSLLQQWGCELVVGDLDQPASLKTACQGVTVVIHCAAKVGDWGSTDDYRRVNVDGTKALLDAALQTGTLRRWVQISSLGVYEGRDHYGTDESTQPSTSGIDGYTLTKVESELLVRDYMQTRSLPGVVLRPGFIYGPRDRTVLPRLLERLKAGKFAFLGNPEKLMNNTYVGNLCEAVWLAVERDDVVGEVFNIRDPRAVTKREFIDTVCDAAGLTRPTKIVPLPVAKFLAGVMEKTWKLLKKQEAPLLNSARIKFLGLNLDYSIDKAARKLGYHPSTDFRDAMTLSVKSRS